MKKQWWHGKTAYQIYPKSFFDTNGDGIGDLQGVIRKLDYLKDLGVDIVWLSPCYVSPLADQGYDIADYYAIDPRFGTMEDMDQLLAEAKKRDMYILMDLVVNHCSDEHEWFKKACEDPFGKYGKFFYIEQVKDGKLPCNWRSYFGGPVWEKLPGHDDLYYLHVFHKKQPDLNWENPEVRKALADVAQFWIGKGVGGFRLDAIAYIKKPEEFLEGPADAADGTAGIHGMTANTTGILDYLHEFKSAVQEGTDIFMVGEANGVSADDLSDWVGPNGVFDMVFEFNHVCVDLPDEMNWCSTRDWKLPDLKALFSASQQTTELTGGWYPMFLENHDQPRSIDHFLPEGADRTAGGKTLAVLLLTMRGTPFIMSGEELGYVNVRWEDISQYNDISTRNHYKFALEQGYSEEEALKGVHRFARDSSRTPMQWDKTENAGFTSGTPWLPVYPDYPDYNVAAERGDANSILNWYIRLGEVRRGHPELMVGDYDELFHEDEQIFAYLRTCGKEQSVVLINLSLEEATYDPAIVENAEVLIGTNPNPEKGVLRPLEAVIYHIMY